MKKFDAIISFISVLLPMIVSLPLLGSTNEFLNRSGDELFFLSIAFIIIFICNNKTIKVPINFKKLNFKLFAYIFFISLLSFISVTCIICIAKFLKIGDFSIVDSTTELTVISVISAIIIGPICEEIFFRVAILGALLKKFSKHIAILIQGIIFAYIHCFSFTSVTFYVAFVGGIVLGYVFYYSKSILLSIFCHAAYNAISMLPFDFIMTTNISIFISSIFFEIVSLIMIAYLIKKVKYLSL